MRISDWSSDVCSSDLPACGAARMSKDDVSRIRLAIWIPSFLYGRICDHPPRMCHHRWHGSSASPQDRKSVVSGKSVSVRVDLGGRRIIKKKNIKSTHLSRCIQYNHKKTNI